MDTITPVEASIWKYRRIVAEMPHDEEIQFKNKVDTFSRLSI